jgi:hypothetical protein
MTKFAPTIALIAAVSSIHFASAQSPSPTDSPESPPPSTNTECRLSSWSPELYSFWGKKEVVIDKLARIPTQLAKHRLAVQISQGDTIGDMRLFEQQNDGSFTVTEWSTRDTAAFLTKIDKAIMDNKGRDCVGEKIKAVLATLGKGKISTGVAPTSQEAAFSPSVNEVSGDFIKSTVIFGC